MNNNYKTYNQNCIDGMKEHVLDNSIDLIFTDPPYGIKGSELDKHYARDESKVVDGYIDVPIEQYNTFSDDWISEAARCLKPGGSFYIISGYTGLRDILNALAKTELEEVNHLIAQYSFGVSTKKKWVSSHYHILYYVKPPIKMKTFNTLCRYTDHGDSYHDRLSVQELKRVYKPGQIRNKNQLPEEFIEKYILYSSNSGDIIMDPFMGGFTTARVALKYSRKFVGFELNKKAYDAFAPGLKKIKSVSDPLPIEPPPDVLKKRLKKREGYKKARARKKQKNESDSNDSLIEF